MIAFMFTLREIINTWHLFPKYLGSIKWIMSLVRITSTNFLILSSLLVGAFLFAATGCQLIHVFYLQVESAFFREFAPVVKKVVTLPQIYYAEGQRKDPIINSTFMTISECLEGWHHVLNPTKKHAEAALHLCASLHSVSWRNDSLLAMAEEKLWKQGGYWTLEKRSGDDRKNMISNWEKITLPALRRKEEEVRKTEKEEKRSNGIDENDNDEALLNYLLQRKSLESLGKKTADWEEHIANYITSSERKCIIHGDYKSANIFLRKRSEEERKAVQSSREGGQGGEDGEGSGKEENDIIANMIDFQWTGVGIGMQDVSCYVIGSIPIGEMGWKEEIKLDDRSASSPMEAGTMTKGKRNGRGNGDVEMRSERENEAEKIRMRETMRQVQDRYEERLLRYYYNCLPLEIREAELHSYRYEDAVRDYKICFADYTRFSIAYFLHKCTRDSMRSLRGYLSAGMQRKSLKQCLWMLRRHGEILDELERSGGKLSGELHPQLQGSNE